MPDKIYTKSYTMYGTGGAIEFRRGENGMFVKAASMLPGQVSTKSPVPKGTRRYDWENSVTMHITLDELLRLAGLAEIMLKRQPIKDKMGSFYHERDGVATRLDINTILKNGVAGYALMIKHKTQADDTFKTIATHNLRLEDIIFMSRLFPILVFEILGWDKYISSQTQTSIYNTTDTSETILSETGEENAESMIDTGSIAEDFSW